MYSKKVIKRFQNPKFVGEMKDADAVGQEGNMKCILPNENVQVNDHLIPIKEVKKENKVLGHNGIYNSILSNSKRDYNGKIITLKNKLGKLSLTEDHLVFAIKVPKKRKYFDNIVKKTLIPTWYHATDLESRDISLYPILKETKDIDSIKLDIKKLKWDFKSKDLPEKIPINEDFLRLCGYYLSEGHISEGKCRNYITLAFNLNEENYANDVKEIVKNIFNIEVTLRKEISKKTLKVYIYSANLARFFKELLGKGAENKKIPSFFMTLPVEKQKSLIEGLWKGDGYINVKRKYPRAGYSTISFQLAHQIKTLLFRQKIICSLYPEEEKVKKEVKHKKCYRVHIGDKESLRKILKILKREEFNYKLQEKKHSWFDDNYFYTPITEINKIEYNGEVHNFEIADCHSFTTNAFCVHNCGDIMKIFIKVKNNKISDIKFQTYGCVAAIASSDMLCELAKGKTLDEALNIKAADIIKGLGEIPPIKAHCSVLGAAALKKAINNYKKGVKNENN